MSDPFYIAGRAVRSPLRICVDCGESFKAADPVGSSGARTECCETCRTRRSQIVERLADKFFLVPKEETEPPKQEPSTLQTCTDCGKEFQPSNRGFALDRCCEECHGRRVDLVDHLADQTFSGWNFKGRRKRRRVNRRLVVGVVILAMLAGIGLFAARPARNYYRQWREKTHFERASAHFEKGDYKHAVLDARNALLFNAENTEALRIMAKSYEATGSPRALDYRARIGQLAPKDLENSLAWAAATLRMGDYTVADRILRDIPYTDHDTAQFHHLSATVAVNKRDSAKAEFHWSEAAKLNPDEDAFKLNLASVRLKLGSATERTSALELLNQLRVKPAEQASAMRILLSDAMRHGEFARARELATALAESPKAPFSDKLLRLSMLRTLQDPDLGIWRARLAAEATDRPDYAYEFIIWMNHNGYAREVPAFVPKIRSDLVTVPPVSIAVADSYAVTRNWPELQAALRGSNWLHMEYVRLATLAWAVDRGDPAASAGIWKSAIAAAEGRTERMETLARAAVSWGWEQRAEDVLWNIASKSIQSPSWVLRALWTRSLKQGDTEKMRRVSQYMFEANSKSVSARNNYIFLSLLKRSDQGSPREAAEALYKANPMNPSVVSTYALSLFQLGRARAAAELMETLPPDKLREPSMAFYYGMFLVEAKRPTQGVEYLRLCKEWPLLHEENAMLVRVVQASPVARQALSATNGVPNEKTSEGENAPGVSFEYEGNRLFVPLKP